MTKLNLTIVIFLIANLVHTFTFACTNFLVTKGASGNGSVFITYAADSHTRYGALFFYPAADYPAGSLLEIFHYENGKLLGTIPQVAHTYSVIGFMNEYQVAIGETTFGGRDSLATQNGAILDYGSLMKIALQRSKTAREAIKIMTELVQVYGYATSGESFSISDANEVWIMEMIGKGNYEKGAVWVALQVPDGYVCAHANQARITNFPIQKKNDFSDLKQTCYHSADVISFARKRGWFTGKDTEFSFSDIYAPIDFGGARFCDARVWSFFRKINAEINKNNAYTEYVKGNIKYDQVFLNNQPNPNKFPSNRMPLWVKPDKKLELKDVMAFMRDHYEDTPLDMRNDFGAGPYSLPYRWRPMEFEVDSTLYCNERAISTQQTGYSFVAQSRNWLPNPIGGIFWFGVDDTDATVYSPMYCGINKIPESYKVGNGSMIEWSENSLFWTFNLVTNWCYTRYSLMHPEVEKYQSELENNYFIETTDIDQKATDLYKTNPEQAIQFLTNYSVKTGDELTSKWKNFFTYLFMKYMDGNMKQSEGHKLKDNGNGKGIPAPVQFPGYGKAWEERLIKETGNKFKVNH